VAVAYARSEFNAKRLQAKMTEMEQAKAAGNSRKIAALEAWGKTQQEKMHLQGFGTAPVADLLAEIKDELPKIAQEASVALIVSKWDIHYQNPDVRTVDITEKIIIPFKPDEKCRKIIREVVLHDPLAEDQIQDHSD